MKRRLQVGDVFRHKNTVRQRKVLLIIGNDVVYSDGIDRGVCTRSHFLSICPREVKVTRKDIDIAKKVADGRYKIYEDTVNGFLID